MIPHSERSDTGDDSQNKKHKIALQACKLTLKTEFCEWKKMNEGRRRKFRLQLL
jgi:hypothetical protein